MVERRSKGKLYNAVNRLTNQPVIVRFLNTSSANAGLNDGIPTHVLREISHLQLLDHKNITKILEVQIKDKDIVEIVYEFSDFNLKDFLKEICQNQTQQEKLFTYKKIIFQVLEGINYLHSQGIIHRNLKVENILINKNLEVKITDFGLSKFTTVPHGKYTPEHPKEREQSGRESRRLWYKSPELILRKNIYSYETDVWAIGCVLAEMILRQPLFYCVSEIQLLFKIFKLLGTPNISNWKHLSDEICQPKTFPQWDPINISHISYSQNSLECVEITNILKKNREDQLPLLQKLSNLLGIEGMQLLSSLLCLNPIDRISANNALQHQFFKDIENNFLKKQQCTQIINEKDIYMFNDRMKINIYQNITAQQLKNKLELYLNSDKCQQQSQKTTNFYQFQKAITDQMRTILVDWLFDVCCHFHLQGETLHYSINYLNQILHSQQIEKKKLQLIGIVCLKIADNYNENCNSYYKLEKTKQYCYIAADEYSQEEILEQEQNILKILKYNLNVSTTLHYIKIYLWIFNLPSNIEIFAMFLADLTLLQYQFLHQFNNFELAETIIFLALHTFNYQYEDEVVKQLRTIQFNKQNNSSSKLEILRLTLCVKKISEAWHELKVGRNYDIQFEAIFNKYLYLYHTATKLINIPSITCQQFEKWCTF